MKIESSQISLSAQSMKASQETTSSRLSYWSGERPAPAATALSSGQDTLQLSSTSQAPAQTAAPAATGSADDGLDPKLRLLKMLIEALTGKKIHVMDAGELTGNSAGAQTTATAPQQPAWGLDASTTTSYAETQQLSIQATGVVTTQDGRQINFILQLQAQRDFSSEQNLRILAGNAATDPLVLNLQGFTGSLSDTTFSFDLDNDGTKETPHTLNTGSGFLVFDKNGDGVVNNGSELFGPTTGNGFAELAKQDSDGNQWIDEQDPIYSRLSFWTPDAEGNGTLTPLASLQIGAINLQPTDAPFSLKDASNQLTGESRQLGVYLNEDGTPGTVQQLDLVG